MPHISKEQIDVVCKHLSYAIDEVGEANEMHKMLQSLLGQPEGEPVNIDAIAVNLMRFAGMDKHQAREIARICVTNPPTPLTMLSDDEFTEVSCHISTGKDAIKAFCDKNDLALEKL